MKPLTYAQWRKKYRAAFAEEGHMTERDADGIINEDLAKRDFKKDYDPHTAGRNAARFALYGE